MYTLLFCLAVFASSLQAFAQPSSIWNPKQIHWQERNADGSRYAVLEGDRSRPGPFTYAFFLPDGVWYPPHRHTGAARVVVVSGTLLLGDGPVLDKQKARPIPTGSLFLVPKGAPHWEGAMGDTLIIGVGMGPWTTTMLESPRR